MSRSIAFFDFDGTITTKDTLLEFIKYSKGSPAFYWGFLLNSPYLIAYKLKLISNQLAKEKVLAHFFHNTPVDVFAEKCRLFTKEYLPTLIRPGALEEINRHKQNGVKVVIVSASPENWICQWTSDIQVELIATRMIIRNGSVDGKIAGKNCHGKEKVRRIKEKYVLKDYDNIYAYGDSNGDKPMLSLANHPYFKPFR